MPHNKSLIVALLIACTVSVTAATSAAAAPEFFVEGETLKTAKELEGTGGTSKVKSEIGSLKITINCTRSKVAGKIEAPGASKATVDFEECSLEGSSGCSVENFTMNALDRLIEREGTVEDEFYEEGSGPLITVKVSKCALKGSYSLAGTQICELPGGEEATAEHEDKCSTSGSSLKLGSKSATFESTETIKLVSKQIFQAANEPGLRATSTKLEASRNNGEVETQTAIFVNENAARAVTITAGPLIGGSGLWTVNPMQGAEPCRVGAVVEARKTCTVVVRFTAGANPEGKYLSNLVVVATEGGGYVPLEGEIK